MNTSLPMCLTHPRGYCYILLIQQPTPFELQFGGLTLITATRLSCGNLPPPGIMSSLVQTGMQGDTIGG
jgi:hypothetical protein